MVLNYLFIFFFLISFCICLFRLLFFQDFNLFGACMSAAFDMAKIGFELSIGLTGVMTLWLGIMKIGENGGMVKILNKLTGSFFTRLFPEIPKDHPVFGSILMNISANMLGLDNAATPLGLKAMGQLQEINTEKQSASNSMIMFLVLNTSGLTIIPVSIMVYRAQMGAQNPADIFLPILIATFASSMIGLVAVSIKQKINLFNPVLFSWLLGATALIALIVLFFMNLPRESVEIYSGFIGNFILFFIIALFISLAVINKVNVYESFIEGAKDGFSTAIKIIPYLVAVLIGVGVFRASGAMDFIQDALVFIGIPLEIAEAIPTGLMKPLSGSGARGLMVETMQNQIDSIGPEGVNSFVSRLVCTFQGATDTTFYILAVYFGAAGIKNTRYALSYGLLADAAGLIASILVCYLFFK